MEEKKATPLSRKELEQENSLLIGQLHTLQVELERIEKRQGEAPSEDSEFESIRHANPSVTVTLAPDTKSEKSAFFARFSRTSKAQKRTELIRNSGAFDANWYLQQYPDVAEKEMDAVEHYCKFGVKEGRNPSAYFDTNWYLEQYPDVAELGMNPLYHYLSFGRDELRKPAPARGPGSDISTYACIVDDLVTESASQRATAEAKEKALSSALQERDDWKAIAQAREQELAQLKATYATDNQALKKQLQESQVQIQKSHEQAKALRQECEVLQGKVQVGEEALLVAKDERQELEQQLFAEQEKLVEALNAAEQQHASAEMLREELGEFQARYKSLETERAELDEECIRLEALAEAREQEIVKLKQNQSELESKHELLQEQLQSSNEQVQISRQKIEALTQECEVL